MPENAHNEFDLKIRAMMENAEEEIPSRVWENIESRLPNSEPVPAWIWWRRIGIACAAVAVLALALVPSGFFRNNNDIAVQPQPKTVLADVSQQVQHLPEQPVEDIEDIVSAPVTKKARITVPAPDPKQVAPVTIADIQKSAEFAEYAVEAEDNDETAPQKKEEDASGLIDGKDIDWDTYFKDDNDTPGRKVNVDFKGILGSNDGASKKMFIPGFYALPTSDNDYRTGVYENSASLYGIPLSFGIGMRFYLTDRFSLGTGLNYSLLTRSFTGNYIEADNGKSVKFIENANVVNHMHYVGIPVNAYYDIIQTKLIQFYASAGGSVEKGISSNFRINGDGETNYYRESVPGVQLSVALGIGVQFNVSESWSLYIDPSARYYFDCKQPTSIRTQKPFMFNFEVGVRYNL